MRWRIPLLALLLLLSGCINIEVAQLIHPDGSSDMTVTYDFSAFMQLAASTNDTESADVNALEQNTCGNLSAEPGVTLIDCSVDEAGIVTAHMHMEQTPGFTVTNNLLYTTYRFEPPTNPAGPTIDSGDASTVSLEQMQQMGMSLIYFVTLPAEITSSNRGVIDGDTVRIDLLSESSDGLVIESRIINYVPMLVAAVILLAVIALVLFLVMHRRPHKEQMPRETPNQIEDYIREMRRLGHPDKAIAEQMRISGYDENSIEMYLGMK